MIRIVSYIISFAVMYFVPFFLYWVFGICCGLIWYHYFNSVFKDKYGISLADFVKISEKEKFSDIYKLNEKLIKSISYVLFVLNYSFFWPGMFFLDLAEAIKPNSAKTLPPLK